MLAAATATMTYKSNIIQKTRIKLVITHFFILFAYVVLSLGLALFRPAPAGADANA